MSPETFQESYDPGMPWMRRVTAALVIVLAFGGAQTTAHAAVGIEGTARAFVAAINAENPSRAVTLVAPTLRFWTASNPSVTYRGRARYDFLASGFGHNCALAVVRGDVLKRSVRTVVLLIEVRADSHHACGHGKRGVRVTFTMAFTQTGKIRSLRIADA
jgi:hypothetical protein